MQRILDYIQGDRLIWVAVMVLSVFSMLAVYSSTGSLAFKYQGGNTEYYVIKHGVLLLLGLCVMFLAHRVNYNYYSRFAQIAMLLSVPLLLLTLFMGTDINDAKRWITLPIIGISFQTSDLAKLALITYLARVLSRKQHIIADFEKSFLPIVAPVLLICMLIVPADLSSSLVLFITCMILMFIGRISVKHISMTIAAGMVAFLFYFFIASVTPLQSRIDTWVSRLENFRADEGENYQVQQAKIAIANGGVFGLGPGKSAQRNFLPQPYSDYIYAIIMEEYGLAGGILIMLLYLIVLWRSIVIFARSPGAFGALLAIGLALSLIIQAFMNMAVTVDLLPVTGLNLPFLSMGGTSTLFSALAVGIILSVSRYIEQQEAIFE